jgi:hypothetical protein
MKMFLLPETIRDGLIQYLQQRPYAEVCNVMPVLFQLSESERESAQPSFEVEVAKSEEA